MAHRSYIGSPLTILPQGAWDVYAQQTGASYSEDEFSFENGLGNYVTEAQYAKMQPLHFKVANNKTITLTRDAQILPRSITGSPTFGGIPGRIYLSVSPPSDDVRLIWTPSKIALINRMLL